MLDPFTLTQKAKDRVIWPTIEEIEMAKKLYVGNLGYDVSNSSLQQLFSAHGNVQSAQVIMDRDTGRSKGFGFVEMDSDREAQEAMVALDGKDHDGRALKVNEAKPRESRNGSSSGFGSGRGTQVRAF